MKTTTETTVREYAIENPSSIRVFESLGIDYCCGGKKSLSDACSSGNIDVNRVLELLENADRESKTPDSGNWKDKPLSDIAAHIVEKHHGFARRETPRIAVLLSRVIERHGSSNPEVAQIEQLFTAVTQELATHMLKEEQVLFPYIGQMEQAVLNGRSLPPAFFGSVMRPIANMMAEHDDAAALLSQIRQLSGGFTAPAGACPTFRGLYHGLEEFERDLHRHVHLENNILFPRAMEMENAGK
ncbi:MAG: iron-sulfur cluster repair di-iron protein [Terriglobia bacterium]